MQVPKGYQAQALPIPPKPVPIKPRKATPKPTGLIPPKKVEPGYRPPLVGDRPVTIVKNPVVGKPTEVGYAIPTQTDPYAQPGLIDNIAFEKQVFERAKRAMKVLTDSMAAKQRTLGRPLSMPEKGQTLTDTFRKELGPAPSIEKLRIPKEPVKRAYRGKTKLVQIYSDATHFVGPRLMKAIEAKDMPSFVPTSSKRAYHQTRLSKIQFNPKIPEHLQHEFGHHLSTLGSNLKAEILFRERFTTGTRTVKIPGGGTGKTGVWGDQYCGRRYKNDHGTEVFSQAMGQLIEDGRLSTGLRVSLKNMTLANYWEANPEHIGFTLAYLQGSFI